MTEKRFTYLKASKNNYIGSFFCNDIPLTNDEVTNYLNEFDNENEQLKSTNMEYEDALGRLEKDNMQLKKELNKLKKFEYGGEHIRLSINIETGKLQRHIYATGQWFGDFDRVLVDNWLSKEDYQKFINRIIEVYNTEFKKELK